ncbi:MAG TPA: hypothetical protein VN253_06125, partial [Kofleriaceae bacterium]|nr:hypothetical protein [Kofleriaceae bacterium]
MEQFAPVDLERVTRPGGGFILRSRASAPPYARCLGDLLVRWAREAPSRTFLAERAERDERDERAEGGERGGWRRMSYAEVLEAVRAIAQALLDRGLGAARPLAILSGNSMD